jgi:hypothetical protein
MDHEVPEREAERERVGVTCRWALGCTYPVSLVEGKGDSLCLYHFKVFVGLIVPEHVIGRKTPVAPRKRRQVHIPAFLQPFADPAGVVTEERLMLAEALHEMGADENVIRAAMARPLVSTAKQLDERYGSGVMGGAWIGPRTGRPRAKQGVA